MVRITIDNQTFDVPEKVWHAFMDATAWIVDSGDMYTLLSDKYDRETLDALRELKGDLYLSSLVAA